MCVFFFQAEDGIRDLTVTGVQTCALPIFSIVSRNAAACAESSGVGGGGGGGGVGGGPWTLLPLQAPRSIKNMSATASTGGRVAPILLAEKTPPPMQSGPGAWVWNEAAVVQGGA